MKRRLKTEHFRTEAADFFVGPVTDVAERLLAICDGSPYSNVSLQLEIQQDDYGDTYFGFYGDREETEQELVARVNKEKAAKDKRKKLAEAKLKEERKLYEKLRNKFDPAGAERSEP